MKMLLLPVLILGLGCVPHAYHLGVSAGELSFDRPVSDADTHAVYAGVSWYPQQRQHESRMEDLAVASLAHAGMPMAAIQEAMDSAPEEEHIPILDTLAEEPETWDAALIRLMWVASLCLAGFMAVYVWKSGLLERLLPKKKD